MFSKFIRNYKEFGLAKGSLYHLHRVLSVFGIGAVYRYAIVAQPITEKKQLPAHRGRNIETRWLESGDPSLEALPRPEAAITNRFRQGSRCLGAFVEGSLVGCLWYIEQQYREDEVRCDFLFSNQSGCVWDFDVYVDPKYRIGYVFLRLWDDVNEHLHRSGFRWTLSRISEFNLGSVRAHARLGAKVVGSATFIDIGRRQWCWSTFCSGVLYSPEAKDYPVLEIKLPADLQQKGSGKGAGSLGISE